VTFFEVSAVENENISEAIEVLASQIYEVYSYEKLRRSQSSGGRTNPKVQAIED
jgi:hypothetical protein